eukprot:CAMPEP_0174257784 /NCGR_PEP_ID=MMETSP0439-20130205/6896_1 /TAXON_ID=0 /ORGANISM="Stereomyxa ramosa, Strain Chinc5" /LENGTH=605 /DNA_ID=CAMNT_0015341035 /DNA_START=36 /DNA_END=1850 /DNA_ORIENTATION=+
MQETNSGAEENNIQETNGTQEALSEYNNSDVLSNHFDDNSDYSGVDDVPSEEDLEEHYEDENTNEQNNNSHEHSINTNVHTNHLSHDNTHSPDTYHFEQQTYMNYTDEPQWQKTNNQQTPTADLDNSEDQFILEINKINSGGSNGVSKPNINTHKRRNSQEPVPYGNLTNYMSSANMVLMNLRKKNRKTNLSPIHEEEMNNKEEEKEEEGQQGEEENGEDDEEQESSPNVDLHEEQLQSHNDQQLHDDVHEERWKKKVEFECKGKQKETSAEVLTRDRKSSFNSFPSGLGPLHNAVVRLRKIMTECTVWGKINCLIQTSQCIENLLASLPGASRSLGAEEKFPVFVLVVMKAEIPHIASHCNYMFDFIPSHSITQSEGGYRLTELNAALELIEKLDWSLRNEKGAMISLSTLENELTHTLKIVHQKQEKEKQQQEMQKAHDLQIQQGNIPFHLWPLAPWHNNHNHNLNLNHNNNHNNNSKTLFSGLNIINTDSLLNKSPQNSQKNERSSKELEMAVGAISDELKGSSEVGAFISNTNELVSSSYDLIYNPYNPSNVYIYLLVPILRTISKRKGRTKKLYATYYLLPEDVETINVTREKQSLVEMV